MAAEALPAPTTTSLPRGGAGKCGGTHSAGCAEAMAASNMCRSSTRGWRGAAASLMAGALEHRLEQGCHFRGVSRDLDPALLHHVELLQGGAFASGDDRARVAHALPRRRRDAGDESHHRLLHVML